MNTVASALTARDFALDTTIGDFELWCGEIGCDKGMDFDIENRNLGEPFGGDSGRQQPLLISDNMAISSSALPPLVLSGDAVTDKLVSLADNPTYIAAVNSINPDNMLIQASFVYFTEIVPNVTFTSKDDKKILKELGNLPQYELVMFADTATDTEQVVYVSLVYSALEDAEAAVEIIPERLATMDSFSISRPIQEIFDYHGVSEIIASAVFDEVSDRAGAVFEFHAPLASSDEEDRGDMGFVVSSRVYKVFITMYYVRDTDWLAADIRDN